MKPASLGSEAGIATQYLTRRGILRSVRKLIWRMGMALRKRYYSFQDWTGLYNYAKWSRFFERGSAFPPTDAGDICFSVVIRQSESNPSSIKDTFSSLVLQSHQNWEAHLIIDQDSSNEEWFSGFVNEPRIQLMRYPAHPTWKDALAECEGYWIVYLNCGDTLAVGALAWVAQQIKDNPNASIIYSDTDCLSLNGSINHSPSFWPNWSPELLLSINYLRPAYVHRSTLQQAAQKTDDYEDALLRCVEAPGQVIHIPQVLCHQRYIQDNPWVEDSFKPESIVAHLERSGLQEVISELKPAINSARFSWLFDKPHLSIIILTRDHADILKRCVDSIFAHTAYPNFEILLVDNNSHDKDTFAYYEQLKTNPQVKVLTHNLPFNYSAFNNWGAGQATGELLLFLNNDIQCFEPGWLEELARWACLPEIGVVGAKLLYLNGAIQHAGLVIGLEGHANHIFAGKNEGYCGLFGSDEWYRDYSAVTGACMMMRRSVFSQIGGFDEKYMLAFNDVEICLRAIQAGYRVVYTPWARLYHYEGSTRSKTKPASDIRLAYQHLKPLIEKGDPYYNPNLSLVTRVPTLRRPREITAMKRLEQIVEFEG